jgi:hypothetical protein
MKKTLKYNPREKGGRTGLDRCTQEEKAEEEAKENLF